MADKLSGASKLTTTTRNNKDIHFGYKEEPPGLMSAPNINVFSPRHSPGYFHLHSINSYTALIF